jgi:cell division transport system permease protein
MGTITTTMLLFGSLILLAINVNSWIEEWGESLSMSVYVEDGIDEKTKNRIESILIHLKGAEMKGFVSKKQAMAFLKEGLGDQAGLLNGLKKNPLPASFEIVFKDVRHHQVDPKEIKRSLEKIAGVTEVQYSEQWTERIKGIMSVVKLSGFVIGCLFCIGVLFITTNTIKLTIYSRRDEVEIFKLVGATDWFIKTPFLIEGAIQGIFSGLVAILILFGIYSLFSIKTVHLLGLPALNIIFLPNEYTVFIILLSLILGLLGGFIAIGRFFNM